MPINSKRVGDAVVRRLDHIGIDSKVGTSESHTAVLIRIIIDEVLKEVVNNGEVIIKNVPVQTAAGPGVANGKADII